MKKVILVGGTPFSGSTVFHMMLANDPKGLAIGEVKSLFLPVLAKHTQPECSCEEPNCSFWNRIRKQGADHLYETIFDLCPQVDTIVDSSKFPFWIDRQNKQLPAKGIQVENVLIWKTPVEYAASCWKRREIFPRNWQQWARDWVDYHRLYLSLVQNWQGVQYANLAANSAQTLTAVGNYLGLPYFPGKERFWEKPQHVLFGNRAARGVPKARKPNTEEQKSATRATLPASVEETIQHEAAFVRLQKVLLQCDILGNNLPPLHGKDNDLHPTSNHTSNSVVSRTANGANSLQAQRLSWPMVEYRRLRAATLTTIGHYRYGKNLP